MTAWPSPASSTGSSAGSASAPPTPARTPSPAGSVLLSVVLLRSRQERCRALPTRPLQCGYKVRSGVHLPTPLSPGSCSPAALHPFSLSRDTLLSTPFLVPRGFRDVLQTLINRPISPSAQRHPWTLIHLPGPPKALCQPPWPSSQVSASPLRVMPPSDSCDSRPSMSLYAHTSVQ